MMFDNLKSLVIPEGSVYSVTRDGVTLWKKSRLPVGYTELDYIETTGTQYINLNFKPNQNSRLVCEALYYGGTGVCGARNSTSSNNHALRVINGKWQFGYGDALYTSGIAADYTDWHVFDLNQNRFYLDGVLAVECEVEEFQCDYAYALGAIRAGSIYYGKGRYRAARVYDDGVLIRDVLPCIDPDGVAGMYDTVNAVFYGNAGSGEFACGELGGDG